MTGVPRSFDKWHRRYFVIGGAIAPLNVLQVYKSKAEYEEIVVRMFQDPNVRARVKTWRLTKSFKCTNVKTKSYSNTSVPVKYFQLKTPKDRLKTICFAAESTSNIQTLHGHVKRFTN
eukprot:CAMPEP_0113948610 /NCGR_PEP_ID=MMETSP1339-20121228/71115_1 /TAXON_ID=94617 /ORGANISM="Fibrocapsa japonica" /LENGTH=117 /DNA_ID=CAMNT_0000955721 /DNA_START=44 /DNA_END=397 /DNA_ORIENTATION=+ /assembly_acc=CAM_ASM_000762